MARFRLPALWLATILVHLWLMFEASLNPQTAPFNDVNLYGVWAGQIGSQVLGVNSPWVYPFLALGPILAAKFIGASIGMLNGWLLLVCLLNLIGLSALVDWGNEGKVAFRSAAYYLSFIALLGPVAIGRIDAAATFIAMLGLVQVYRNRFKLAMGFFTLGAWVKIWPVAAALALAIATKSRFKSLLASATAVASILAFGFLLGGNENLFSFITMQGSRGLQVESVLANIWVWAAKFGAPGAGIYFDTALVTNQVSGALVPEAATLLGLAMVVALAITAWLGIRAFRAGADLKHLFVAVFLTATLDLIVFNKVGSPQFELWLAVPLIAGILLRMQGWRLALGLGASIALLTNLLYPIFYMDLMALGSLGVWVLTVRNLTLVALLIVANVRLSQLAR